jgi:hypothetical protein
MICRPHLVNGSGDQLCIVSCVQIDFEENPEPLLERGPALRGGSEEALFCQEIAEHLAVNFSPLRDGDEESTRYSGKFSDMHSLEGACARDERGRSIR